MASNRGSPLTIGNLMTLVCAIAIVLSLFAANPGDSNLVIGLIIFSLVFVVPVVLAIEGNRRDDIAAGCAGEEKTGEGSEV